MKPIAEESSLLFDEALSNFQEDLVRIATKHRFNYHHLSVDEIVSEANLELLKNKEKIINSWEGEFHLSKFKQIAYVFTRNLVKWTHERLKRNSYVSKREDYVFETESGSLTSFEVACDNACREEEPESFSSDSNEKCSYILKMIKDYCFILTEQELKVLNFKEQGLNLREIGVKLEITHQAVSCIDASIRDKIKSHLSINPFEDNSAYKVSEGQECLKDFFTSYPKFSKKDKSDLINLIKSSIGQLTGSEIAETFKGGKFTPKQVNSFCAKNGLSPFLRKPYNKSYTLEEEMKIIKMVSNGAKFEEIASALGRDERSMSSKLNYLRSEGRISSYPSRCIKSLSPEDKELLGLFKEGNSSSEIAYHLGESNVRTISAKKGHFTKKGLLPHARMERS